MRPTPHILVVNGTKVRRPVFVVGAPHSGQDLVARALKHSAGIHLTLGRPAVVKMIYAFARRPSIATERGRGAARVMRDAFAESWQFGGLSCADCPAECWELSGYVPGEQIPDGTCMSPEGVHRFADASPDLIYSADVLLDAFPDAQLVQVIRDGRDVVARMLGDDRCMTWFKPGFINLDEVFPNPFLGVDDPGERARWTQAGPAVKCALRWRGSIRLSARLRAQIPAEQLLTLRYENMVNDPAATATELSNFLGGPISKIALTGATEPHRTDGRRPLPARQGEEERSRGWRDALTARQIVQVEKVAGRELKRLGYSIPE
ncbi:sulfotransferase [Actinocorallia longicatena]|uniref:Sulfotransferase family protein n=1 Tax=Actinocorallia longicatena TaxID=111803 RepID=A0ABP6Q6Q2_9ACTN